MNFFWVFVAMLSISTALRPFSKDGKSCTSRHFKKTSLGNQALRLSNLISSHNVHLLGECHIFCVNTHNCYGYNFRVSPSNIYTVNCQLSNNTVKLNMTRMRNGSWIFYEDVLVTKDIDECSQDSHTCHSNATCINNPGFYDCKCRNGYTGNGHTCTDINECFNKSTDCNSNANCTNTDGSYKCKCNQGYQGNGYNCTDIDECSQDSHTCHSNATCINNPGSYDCQCRNGYSGNGHTCPDINECLDKSTDCDSNANCTNTDGSYQCKCSPGYRGNGRNCTDIDECSEGSYRCHADATCNNIKGSYNCICSIGKYCQNPKDVSEILKNEPVEFENKLGEWLPKTGNWSICWRATRDGWASSTFHSGCDGKSPTLTFVQVIKNNKKYVFGGYATVPWTSSSGWTSASGSFLFSLRNYDSVEPFKAPLKNQNDIYAIYCSVGYGPTFGGGHDLYIASDARSNTNSYTNFGYRYQAPSGYTYGNSNTQSLLAGSHRFSPSEVEVLYLNKKPT